MKTIINCLLFLHLSCTSGRRNVVSLFDGKYCETEFKTDNSCRYNGDLYTILQRWNKPIVSSIWLIYCNCLHGKVHFSMQCLVIIFISWSEISPHFVPLWFGMVDFPRVDLRWLQTVFCGMRDYWRSFNIQTTHMIQNINVLNLKNGLTR